MGLSHGSIFGSGWNAKKCRPYLATCLLRQFLKAMYLDEPTLPSLSIEEQPEQCHVRCFFENTKVLICQTRTLAIDRCRVSVHFRDGGSIRHGRAWIVGRHVGRGQVQGLPARLATFWAVGRPPAPQVDPRSAKSRLRRESSAAAPKVPPRAL